MHRDKVTKTGKHKHAYTGLRYNVSPRRDSTYNGREVRPLSILKRRLKLCNKRSSDSVRKNNEQYVFAVSVREAMRKFEHQVYRHTTWNIQIKEISLLTSL